MIFPTSTIVGEERFAMQAFIKLTAALWKYSAGRRHLVVLYAAFCVIGNTLYLFEPYLVGKILNGIQHAAGGREGLFQIWWYLGLLVLIAIGFWCFHGPARILERENAFFVRRA